MEFEALYQLQEQLVLASTTIAALGVVLLGFSMVVMGSAPVFAYRVRRLGLQILGAVLVILAMHAVAVDVYDGRVPIAWLLVIYGIIGLMILQGLLNLLFGPNVGNSVVSRLLGTLIIAALGLAFAAYSGLWPT